MFPERAAVPPISLPPSLPPIASYSSLSSVCSILGVFLLHYLVQSQAKNKVTCFHSLVVVFCTHTRT